MTVSFMALYTLLSLTRGNSLWRAKKIATMCDCELDTRQFYETNDGYAARHIKLGHEVCNLRYPTYQLAARFYGSVVGGQADRARMLMPVMLPPDTKNAINFGMIALVRCPLEMLYTPLMLSELNCTLN
jgi:hypothetical protein